MCPGTGNCELGFSAGIISVVAKGELLVHMDCAEGLQLKVLTSGIWLALEDLRRTALCPLVALGLGLQRGCFIKL